MNRQQSRVDLCIRCGEHSRMIAAGEVVDLDEALVPAAGDRPAQPVGAHIDPAHFTPAPLAQAPGRSRGNAAIPAAPARQAPSSDREE